MKKELLLIGIILLSINSIIADCIIENNSVISGSCDGFYGNNISASYIWIILLSMLLALILYVISYYEKHMLKRKEHVHHNSYKKKHHRY
jgi:uncharacterized membrane protein